MNLSSQTIEKATFNPQIKTFIFWMVAMMLVITIMGIPILLIWVLGVGQRFSRKYYENLSCKLTNLHLEFKKGVLFKVEKTIPLENIQDLTFIENPILNYFNLRILKVETAGNSNPKGSDMKLIGIMDMDQFKIKVLNQRELLKNKNEGKEQADLAVTNQYLKEIKDLLLEIKNKP